MTQRIVGQLLMAGALIGTVACSQEPDRTPVEVERPDARDDVDRAARETADQARETADDARDAAARAGERAGDAADRAGDNTANAIERAGDAAKGAVETADIKTALAADDLVKANDINVDTNGETKVVTLKGTVQSAAARARAEAIAKREADGYRIDNQLVVRVG